MSIRPITKAFLVCLVVWPLGAGCIAPQLRKETVRQATTVSDLYEQQVLDNLAKFVQDRHAMPHFSIATGGANNVNDQYSAGGNSSWAKDGILSAAGFTLGLQRQIQDGWTTAPVSDSHKLQLMQCAYQRAVSACLGTGENMECPDCSALINLYYTGDVNKSPRDELEELRKTANDRTPVGAARKAANEARKAGKDALDRAADARTVAALAEELAQHTAAPKHITAAANDALNKANAADKAAAKASEAADRADTAAGNADSAECIRTTNAANDTAAAARNAANEAKDATELVNEWVDTILEEAKTALEKAKNELRLAPDDKQKNQAVEKTMQALNMVTTAVGKGAAGKVAAPATGGGASTSASQRKPTDVYGVTTDCLNPGCCWFHVCCDKCIARHRGPCCKIGKHCGVYVVVEPGIGQEMLSRLTMVMLDITQYDGADQSSGTEPATLADKANLLKLRQSVLEKLNEVEQRIARSQLRRDQLASKPRQNWTPDDWADHAVFDADDSFRDKLADESRQIENLLKAPAGEGPVQRRTLNPYYAPTTFPALQFRQQLNTLAPNPPQ